ncbi:hypothetical protein HH310_22900 [Actinoplanes sp. TBRC 11911]|uniref:EsaB/YukD family protein n=1 Tax=Actinoplanes sp. TBRC 11911 TaxID=2729386 RepID=UPI00145D727B|nr:EsaB/YukD family protein [Actinoplanes sp. TBRC 11911]NMO54018.1 hypothetical protein [Actinoplanes sp. TBRC 11911]
MNDTRCRVTVVGVENRVDVAIPADAPIAQYNDLLARLVGQPEDDALPPVWSLAPIGAPAFAITSSLAGQGVEDGAVLYLRDTLAGEDQEPVVRSVWEVVADLGENGVRWDARAIGRTAVVLGAFWLAAAIVYAGFSGHSGLATSAVAAVVAVGLAVLARVTRSHPRVLPEPLRTVFGCAAIPGIAAVAVLAPGHLAVDATHLIYFAVGVFLGFVVALAAVPGVLLATLTLLAGVAGILLAVLVAAHATASAVAATVVVAGVLFLAVAPRAAGVLVAASWLSISSATVEPDADPDRLAGQVTLARRVLVLLVAVPSVAVGAGLVVLTRLFDPFTMAVAIVATVVLLVRTGTFERATEAIVPAIAATTGIFALLTLLDRSAATQAYVLPALLLVGVIAIGAGLPVLLWGAGVKPGDGDKPSRLSPLLTVGQIMLPALLLGVYGLYDTLWHLGGR